MTTARQTAGTRSTTDGWLRLARGAATTMVAWAVITHITAQMIIPPVLVIGLVFAGFIPFLRNGRRMAAFGMGIFAALALAGNVPGLVDELSNPDSAPAFILTLLSVIGAVLAIAAGIGAFRSASAPPTRRIVAVAAAIFVVLAATSIVISAAAESDAPLAGDIEVIAERVEFGPDAITLGAGVTGVWIDNRDGIRHTFTIEDEGVELEIPALKARRVDLDLTAGSYAFTCTVPGHENMKGTLTVTN